jgi:hypothetical protein
VVALFHVLEKEMEWRESTGRGQSYGALRAFKPIVAIGAEHALEDEILMADHFRKMFRTQVGSYDADQGRWCRRIAWCSRGSKWSISFGDTWRF